MTTRKEKKALIIKLLGKEKNISELELNLIDEILTNSEHFISEKQRIKVDYLPPKQKENTKWQNLPCYNIQTQRSMPEKLGYYFYNWKEYLSYQK